ncbi:MAG: wax ester/triacylglycerol synthase family O-acyltransferase [Proteobacteria bacterium]|nr:wax ester/triacylglycerol synthase family O-acyltransferase [Pseudomonadota bacterium]
MTSVKRLGPSDAMFLYGESRETMLHVAGLMQFTPPPDTPPDYLRGLMDEIRDMVPHYPWNVRLRTPNLMANPMHAWVHDDELDLEYHVRRSALPSPGDERELGILVSRLHGNSIDFHYPPWECHLIEGLEGGRFAMYIKVHHALVDGFSAMRILASALTTDPDDRTQPLFFAIPPPARGPRPDPVAMQFAEFLATVREQYGATKVVARAIMKVARREQHELVSPSQAPRCILNGRISRNRRFATARMPMARVKALARASGATINDVVLALSSAAIRRYLTELDALPAEPLIAMLPVSVRAKDDVGGGNSVGAILASLATHLADPAERLAAIVASTKMAKQQLEGMSRNAILSYSALLVAPALFQLVPGIAGHMKPAFNVVISNVPGPEQPLYFRGARLDSTFPMSVPVHGQALNITCNSYAGSLCFGFTGCRDTLPRLQRMAVACAEALEEYEHALLPG